MDQKEDVMAKRANLLDNMRVVPKAAEADVTATPPESMRITSIHLPRELLRLLRIAAAERADRHGGRPSVSAVVVDVLERHRDEIEAELLK